MSCFPSNEHNDLCNQAVKHDYCNFRDISIVKGSIRTCKEKSEQTSSLNETKVYDYIATRYEIQHIILPQWFSFNDCNCHKTLHPRRRVSTVQSLCFHHGWSEVENSRPGIVDNMTSFAHTMAIFLWQIVTVIPMKDKRNNVDMLPNKVVKHYTQVRSSHHCPDIADANERFVCCKLRREEL